jgi:hemolysin activation/secretion protein
MRTAGAATRVASARIAAIIGIAMLGCVAAANAQQAPLPGSVAPGQIERQFQRPPEPRAPGAIDIPQPPSQRVAPIPPNVRVELRALEITGSTVFAPDEFRPLYAEMIGKTVALEQIYLVAAQISSKYHDAGYFLAQAIVPPQEVNRGTVQIRVIEGYVAKVKFEGDIRGPRGILEGYGDKIAADRPARLQTFERYLLLMNDLPGVSAHATIQPDPTEIGAADLLVQITHKTVGAFFSADDRGTKFLGPEQLQLGTSLNSLAHLYEQISLRGIVTPSIRELRYGDGRYVQPIGSDGFRTELFGSVSETHPGFTLSNQNVHSDYRTVSFSGFYPVLRSRNQNWTVGGGFNIQDSTTNQLVTDAVSLIPAQTKTIDDRLRYISLSSQYDVRDRLSGTDLVYVEARQGIDGLGSTKSDNALASNPGASPNFTLFHATLQRQQGLGSLLSGLGVLAAVDGQYAFSRLLVEQQYAFGGEQYGRAYDPAEITGDRGVAAKIEPQYTFGGIPRFIDAFQLYVYYDFGYVWNFAPGSPALVNPPARTATGAATGIGLRFFAPYFTGYIEMAKPLTRSVATLGNDGKDPRFFFHVILSY